MMKKTLIGLIALLCIGNSGAAEITPKIVNTAAKEVKFTITLTPEEISKIKPDNQLQIVRDDSVMADGSLSLHARHFDPLQYQLDGDKITLTLPVDAESERTIRLINPTKNPKKPQIIFSVVFAAVDPDLFVLRPLKGDFHAHSEVSDGKHTPFAVGAHARRVGLDFFALTDHRKQIGSATMVQAFAPYRDIIDFLPIHGEEFHSENARVHSLGFGLRAGVHDWVEANQEEYKKLTDSKMSEITNPKLKEIERRNVAEASVLYQKAREFGAELIIFCHPYWRPFGRYNGTEAYTNEMFKRKEFDAVEITNGVRYASMFITLSKIIEEERKGNSLRTVSVSDTHDAQKETFGTNFTVVFAPKNSVKDIAEAIKSGKSVSANVESPEKAIFFGDRRLVKYCYFLLDNYFKDHDEILKKQGLLLLDVAQGKELDREAINKSNQALSELKKRTWAETDQAR